MFLPQLVRRASSERPDSIAIETRSHRLSYAWLDAHSDRWAGWLEAQGFGRGAVIAVSMSRTPQLVVALLGILKAGAAYLPVDPSLPAHRRQLLLDDAGAQLVLTDELWNDITHGEALPITTSPEVVQLADDDLAYVIYTSGSTGRPKGVEIPHGALANFVQAMRRTPGLDVEDRVLAHTTISFDIHVLEIWLPLVVGATVVLVDSATSADPDALARTIDETGVTVVQATPALWTMLLGAGWTGSAAGTPVRALCGGEALARDLADALLAARVDLWNMYGPTETTVWSTVWRVEPTGPILIGAPIDRTTLHVVSETLAEVMPGDAGELCIGGAGLARGYRGRPDLTAERFIQHPSASVGRLYRTGDLVRRRADDGIEYLGRLDQQVKIAGHRVEPGEIEVALRRLPGVRDAVVVDAGAGTALHRLVAYLVTARAAQPAAIRSELATTLPSYMIPSVFVTLDALPLTPSGKVDRRALPPPAVSLEAIGSGRAAAPATTPTEAALIPLWQEVLGVADSGVDQDFFDLGGHSRLGAFLLALVAQRFGQVLPLPTLAEASTIRALARVIDAATSDAPPTTAPVVRLTEAPPNRPTLYLAHAAGGHAVIYKPLSAALGGRASVLVFQSSGFETRGPKPSGVEAMAATYVAEMKRLQPAGPYAIGGASFGGVVAYEMARQLMAAGDDVAVLVLFDSELPPLGLSPLARRFGRVPAFRSAIYPLVRRLHAHAGAARRLGPRAYLEWIRRDRSTEARRGHAWSERVGASGDRLLDGLAQVRADNERAFADYIPRPYGGRMLFCRALDVSPSPADTRDGWVDLCGDVTYLDVPGDHHTMLLAPNVARVALIVAEALTALARRSTSSASLPRPQRPRRPREVRAQARPA